jgi:uncharacterized protein (DUF1697 family)
MAKYAAFLRAVNLGPTRKASSAELREAFEGAGMEDVQTFRTSGNVVFSAGSGSAGQLKERVERALADALGFDVAVFLRSAGEMRAIAAHKPFPAKLVNASDGKLQVSLLEAKPSAELRTRVLQLASDQDRLAFGERELFWLPSGRMRDSALDLRALGKLLGDTTMRTMGTMQQLVAKHFPD